MPSGNVGTGDKKCPCKPDCECNLATTACCCDAGCNGIAGKCPDCGCTDPKANNYDPKATWDDCSCNNQCHHIQGHPGCSGSSNFDIKKVKTKRAGLEGYANLIGPEMLIIDELLDI